MGGGGFGYILRIQSMRNILIPQGTINTTIIQAALWHVCLIGGARMCGES